MFENDKIPNLEIISNLKLSYKKNLVIWFLHVSARKISSDSFNIRRFDLN